MKKKRGCLVSVSTSTMKAVILLLALIGFTTARPQYPDSPQLLRTKIQPQIQQELQPQIQQTFQPQIQQRFQPQIQQTFQPQVQQPVQRPVQRPLETAVRNIVRGPVAYILRYDANLGSPSGFSYAVDTSDGYKNAVIGEVKNQGTDQETLSVEGQYSYVGDNGQTYDVYYTADENGFHPSGAHIPPAAGTKRKLGIPSAALASLSGGGLG